LPYNQGGSRRKAVTIEVLGRRGLNRSLLERQLLLRRHEISAFEAMEHLVGLQAQAPDPPYVGLWTRLAGFRPGELSRMIVDRRAVRVALMRNTVHLVSAEDCLKLRPLVHPAIGRNLYTGNAQRAAVKQIDAAELVASGRALLEERPLTAKELGGLLRERWPDQDPAALARAIRNLVPLVQVPPRGVWGESGPAAHTTVEAWLGQRLDSDLSPDEMVIRYLGAFGPASVKDAQTWSGLTRLREVFERLRPRLRTFRDEGEEELFDLPHAPRPDPDTLVPARFVAAFDNLILSHADRSRVIAAEHRKAIASKNGMVPATFLVDGFVRGTWKVVRARREATLWISPFEHLPKQDREALAEEGEQLLNFVMDGAGDYAIRFIEP
jgi:Winged helix DNA-binding domain